MDEWWYHLLRGRRPGEEKCLKRGGRNQKFSFKDNFEIQEIHMETSYRLVNRPERISEPGDYLGNLSMLVIVKRCNGMRSPEDKALD